MKNKVWLITAALLKEWIYVRAKDGTKGYIHVDGENISNVGRPGTEVFSDLNYFD